MRPAKLRDFETHRVHDHVTVDFVGEISAPDTVSIRLGPVDAVGQLHDRHRRKCGLGFSVLSFYLLKNLADTVAVPFAGDQHAGVKD